MQPVDPLREEFRSEGCVWLRGAASEHDLTGLAKGLPDTGRPGARLTMSGALGQAIAGADFTRRILHHWPGMRPVRLVAFDKTRGTNWGVPWHQDRIIAVTGRADLPGYQNWSRKGDIWHCEPPAALLQRMLFVRVNLDDNTAANGAMAIARGSHRAGRIRTDAAEAAARRYPVEVAEAKAGDVLVLNMLTLHRSPPSEAGASRRVLRIDFAAEELPAPLAWAV